MNTPSRFNAASLALWSGGTWMAGPPARIGGFTHSTETIKPGDCYVAIKGARVDGHDLVAEAFRRGAGSALVRRDRASALAAAGPVLAVADPVGALQGIAAAHRRELAIPIVGVSGSVGKTTVKEFIADMLGTTWRTVRTCGNWNNELGLPLSMLGMTADTQVGVFELGISHPGEMAPLCRVAGPTCGVISCIGPVHAEFFPSVEAIAREKAVLLRRLPGDGRAVLSLDDPYYRILVEEVRCRVTTVSMVADADYRALPGATSDTMTVVERCTGEQGVLRLPVPGRHNRHNALLAAAVARGFNVPWPELADALARYAPLPMRWETRQVQGITLINDAYNANLLSMGAALETLREVATAGRKWVVLGGMLELGTREADDHAAVGRQVAGGPWAGLVAVGALGGQVADGAEAAGWPRDRVVRCTTAAEAGEALADRVHSGDVVLFKASRGLHLEDAAARLLERLAARGTTD